MDNQKSESDAPAKTDSNKINKKSRIKSALAEVITYGLVFGWIPPVSLYLVWDTLDIITSIVIFFVCYLFWWRMWRPDWVELIDAIKQRHDSK